jgi:vitamin-K-epoxide reductase (warfarin-sensitive)
MRYAIAVLALAGAIVSVLALRVHYETGTLPCDINAKWDCEIVNHSPFAMMGPVPIAAVGILGYLLLGIFSFAGWRFATLLSASAGFLFAFRLSMIEQYALGVWCLYCAISQGLIAIILLLTLCWFTAEYLDLRRTRTRY